MTETYLGRYAALQKSNAVAAVLDFTGEDWETLKRLKEEDMVGWWMLPQGASTTMMGLWGR